MKRRLIGAAAGLGAAAGAAVALAPGLSSWFVADDFVHLGYVRFINSPWGGWFRPTLGTMIFRPVTFTANFYLARLVGTTPLAFHATDLILHCLNVILVFVLVRRIFGDRDNTRPPDGAETAIKKSNAVSLLPAFTAALLFAVHPLTALTATWFACRADLIATGFSLLCLILVAASPTRTSFLRLLVLLVLGLIAMLAKETHYPLFLAAFALAFLGNSGPTWKTRLANAVLLAAPLFVALVLAVLLRLGVLQAMGAYGAVPASLSSFFAQAAYHLPWVGRAAGQDFLAHHLTRDDFLLRPLLAAGLVLLLAGGAGALRQQKQRLLFGLAFILIALTPAWNLSYMFAVREERLLYFPLLGFLVIVAALAAGARSPRARAAVLVAVVTGAVTFGLYSRQQVADWKIGAQANRNKTDALVQYLVGKGAAFPDLRVYLLGASSDDYYLDTMVKLALPAAYFNREIMVGDHPSFIWESRKMRRDRPAPKGVPAIALPTWEVHATDPTMALETVHPPDLLAAAAQDYNAQVLEWDGRNLRELTSELRTRYSIRLALQAEARLNPYPLPSFSFRKSRIKFDWQLSPGLAIAEPPAIGEPFRFTANNPDPYLVSPPLDFRPLSAQQAEIEMVLPKRSYLPLGQDQGCLMWESKEHPWFSADRMICFPVLADGQLHNYQVPLAANIHWARIERVTRVRLDPIAYPTTFQLVRMEFVAL